MNGFIQASLAVLSIYPRCYCWGRKLPRAERMSPCFLESFFLTVLLAIPPPSFMPEFFSPVSRRSAMKLSGNRRRHCEYVGKTAVFRSVGKIVYNNLMFISLDCYEQFSPYFVGCLIHISTMLSTFLNTFSRAELSSVHQLRRSLPESFKMHKRNSVPSFSSSFFSLNIPKCLSINGTQFRS